MFNNTNASLVNNEVINYIHHDRMIYSKFYELILRNEKQQIIETRY